jgi:flagellar biosynthesis/type III secretory pathway ATPase
MALIDVADKNQIKIIQNRIKKDCIEFNSLSVGNKVKASNQLYMENRILKELGNAAVETIEKMDEEIEYKDNKINVLEQELKEVNSYDEEKINALLNKNPVIRYNNKERAKRRLANTLSLVNK